MLKKLVPILATVSIGFILAGCDSGGKKFEGTWAAKDDIGGYDILKIEDKGDHFKVTNLVPGTGLAAGKSEFTMHMKDKDTIATDDMFDIIYNDENKTIYDGHYHLSKVDEKDVPALVKTAKDAEYKAMHPKW